MANKVENFLSEIKSFQTEIRESEQYSKFKDVAKELQHNLKKIAQLLSVSQIPSSDIIHWHLYRIEVLVEDMTETSYSKKDYFKKDYNEVTSKLLFENVDYKTVKNNLMEVYNKLKD